MPFVAAPTAPKRIHRQVRRFNKRRLGPVQTIAIAPFAPVMVMGVLLCLLLPSPFGYAMAVVVPAFVIWSGWIMYRFLLDITEEVLKTSGSASTGPLVIKVTSTIYDGLRERVGDAAFPAAKQWAETTGYDYLARAARADNQRLSNRSPWLSLDTELDKLANAYKQHTASN